MVYLWLSKDLLIFLNMFSPTFQWYMANYIKRSILYKLHNLGITTTISHQILPSSRVTREACRSVPLSCVSYDNQYRRYASIHMIR